MNTNEHTPTVGQRLRQLRKARGKSQRVISGLAGISVGHLSELETGKVALDRVSEIRALATALGISPAELIRPLLPTPGSATALCGRCGRRGA